jgi:hypothetical protein
VVGEETPLGRSSGRGGIRTLDADDGEMVYVTAEKWDLQAI